LLKLGGSDPFERTADGIIAMGASPKRGIIIVEG
jgi:hypothetical protein